MRRADLVAQTIAKFYKFQCDEIENNTCYGGDGMRTRGQVRKDLGVDTDPEANESLDDGTNVNEAYEP